MHLDAWIKSSEIAIELKYPTRKLELLWKYELYTLRDQSAQDFCCYDFCKDVQRLEGLVNSDSNEKGSAKTGFGILLTNDPIYWKEPKKPGTADADFRLYELRKLTGDLAWSDHANNAEKTVQRKAN